MASLQDLLASKQPNELQSLLASLQGKDPAQEPNSSVAPTPGPTPGPSVPGPASPPPTPLSPEMLGLSMGPNSSTMPKSEPSRAPASDMSPPSDTGEDDSSDDEDDSEESPKMASKGPVKVEDHHYTGDASDEQKKNLQDLFDNVHSLNTLRNAQDSENSNRLLTGLAQASTTLNNGALGIANKVGPPKDVSADFYKEQMKNASAPVTNLVQQQEKDLEDPNSQASADSRKLAGSILEKAGFPPSMIEGMSHNDITKAFPQLTSLLNHKDAVDANRLKAQELHEYQMGKLEAAKSGAGDKNTKEQDKALQSTKTLLESARGNPAAAQAEKDLYAAGKAKSLTNLYGDPNKLSRSQVQLLASEIAKIASGGVPTSHELEGLTPQTLASKFSKTSSELLNNPTPANAGKFVKQYQDYADALTKDAKKVISDKYGRVIESSKKQLGDDNYNTLKDQYLNRFSKDAEESGAVPSTSDMVKVISPSGQSGSIPKEKLNDALQRGFKVAQ